MENITDLAIEKFGKENIILYDGDIYYITLRDDGGHLYEGRKVLSDLKLSQEEFEFNECVKYNKLGEVAELEYKVKVKGT